MKATFIKFLIVISLFFFTLCSKNEAKKSDSSQRYVSLTPSISEIFVYLGAEKYLVGKTQYCEYPTLKSVEVIGSIISPSIEKISLLDPTAIVILESQKKYLKVPDTFKFLTVEQHDISSIMKSVDSLAATLHISSDKTANDLKRIENLRGKFKNSNAKSYISIVSANKINENNVSFYISSTNTYYNDLLSIFNLKNSIIEENPTYQKQSLEYLEKTKPDIIFNFSNTDISKEIVKALSYNPEIITISTDYSSIPGPISVMKLVDTLSVRLHK